MKLSRCGRRLYLLLFVELIVSATASYVQVKFYYKDNNQGTGQSWNSFTPKDGSCGPCTDLARLSLGHDQGFESMTSLCDREVNSQNMGSRGNTWGSYKITEGPPDTSIILFESYSCHGDTSGKLGRSGITPSIWNGIVKSFRVCGPSA